MKISKSKKMYDLGIEDISILEMGLSLFLNYFAGTRKQKKWDWTVLGIWKH